MIDLNNGFAELLSHVGHEIECVQYGQYKEPAVNVALECVTCGCVLVDFDAEEQPHI